MFFTKFIPEHIIATLYTRGSLLATEQGLMLSLKNRLMNATLTGVESVKINGQIVPLHHVLISDGTGKPISPTAVSAVNPIDFPLRKTLKVLIEGSAHLHLTYLTYPQTST